jgi:hypothetical protein
MGVVKQSVGKLRALRPGQIRREAQRTFRLVLIAADEAEREALAQVLIPAGSGSAERGRALNAFAVSGERPPAAESAEVTVCTPRAAASGQLGPGAYPAHVIVDVAAPEAGLRALLRAHPELRLALARTFPPLRDLLARDLIRAVAARNAAVAAISALPEVIPTPLSLLLALGEMGSDTVVITGNQIGLAFELAALRGEVVGWRAQAGPVLSIVAGGLGWRTLAREVVGLIPAGVGLAAKTAIAYSGTMAVGTALWRRPQPRARMPKLQVARSSTPSRELASRRQTA